MDAQNLTAAEQEAIERNTDLQPEDRAMSPEDVAAVLESQQDEDSAEGQRALREALQGSLDSEELPDSLEDTTEYDLEVIRDRIEIAYSEYIDLEHRGNPLIKSKFQPMIEYIKNHI